MAVSCLSSANKSVQVALGFKNETVCVERGGAPKAPVFGGANPASVPSHVRNQVSQPFVTLTFALFEVLHRPAGRDIYIALSPEVTLSADLALLT